MRLWPLKGSPAWAYSTVSRLTVILAAFFCLRQQCQAEQALVSQPNGGFGTVVGWTYGALAVCIPAGVAIAFWRTKKPHRRTRGPIRVAQFKNKPPLSAVSSSPLSVALKKGKSSGHVQPKPGLNRGQLLQPFRRRRRKRIFDYTKFYAQAMLNLSGHAYGPPLVPNGKSHSHGHANGHNTGDSMGHANVHSNSHAASPGTNANQTAGSELENLIAIQKSLIEQQKCLLDEQTRLIEEKRCHIEEQTAFLKAQCNLAAEPPPQPQRFPLNIAQ